MDADRFQYLILMGLCLVITLPLSQLVRRLELRTAKAR